MPTEPKLEQYLGRLEKSLAQIPVSDRADIITEIRSHVLEAKDREPSRSLDQILNSIGEPEVVANRYLMERGLKPGKAPAAPIVKWLTIGFLGTMGMAMLFIFVLVWKFTPLVKVDEQTGKVQILGGLIDVSGDLHSKTEDGYFNFSTGQVKILKGEKTFSNKADQALNFNFNNGTIKFEFTKNNKLSWLCKADQHDEFSEPKESAKGFDWKLHDAKCEIQVPEKLALNLRGSNGKIVLVQPSAPVAIDMSNGKIGIEPNTALQYRYDLKVANGSVDQFKSSASANAIGISVKLINGKIGQI